MSAAVISQQMTVIFLLILLGYVVFRRGVISLECSADLSTLVVQLCSPALIVVSALDGSYSLSRGQLSRGFLLAGALYGVLLLLGLILPRALRAPVGERQQYKLMTIFGNTGFIGIPVVLAVLGPEAMVYVIIFNIYFNFLIYTYGLYQVNKGGTKKMKFSPGMLFNVGTAANLAAIFLFFFQPEIPLIAKEFVNYVGDATIFLSMVIIGGFLARAPLREIFSEGRVYVFVILRQILVPVVLTLILRPWVKDSLMLGTAMLMVAMPVGNLPLMMAEQAGTDGRILSKGIIVTTLCSIVTIPILAFFL